MAWIDYFIYRMKKVQICDFSTGLTEEVAIRNSPQELPNLTEEHLSHCFQENDLQESYQSLQQVKDHEILVESKNLIDVLDKREDIPSPDDNPQVHFDDELSEESPKVQSESSEQIPQSLPIKRSKRKPRSKVSNQKRIKKIVVEEKEDFFKKLKKNVNMPKSIGKYFMKYYRLFKNSLYSDQQQFFESFSQELLKLKDKVHSRTTSIKLEDLKHFFSQSDFSSKRSCLNRLMMRKIITKFARPEIISSNQVKRQLEYLVATKVYSLRCSNPSLATRMQTR